jgi:signal transduction histidine kinase
MTSFSLKNRFIVQLLLVFLLFTFGAVIGLGLPATLLLENQTNRQMQALIDQSNQTTLALLDNKTVQLENLALLVVERPTLGLLMEQEDSEQTLSDYLEEFLVNTGVDALMVCWGQERISYAGDASISDLCRSSEPNGFVIAGNQVWMVSSAVLSSASLTEASVIVGQSFGSALKEFHTQSGLSYYLFQDDQLLAASQENDGQDIGADISADIQQYQTLRLGSDHSRPTHMATSISISTDQDLVLIGLLNIESYSAFNRQLRNITLITLVSVSLLGVVIAILLSRRISKPINQLARSADALREGDLTTPLTTSSKLQEISQLTNALEDARVSLQHSLTQLRKEKAWIEDLLDSIVEGLLTIDDNARITYASQSIGGIIGTEPSGILGRSIDDYFIATTGEELFSHQIPAPNQNRRIPVMMNGKEILLSISTSEFVPPEAGNATRALVIRDVTDEERIHRLIGEFMANITHEFRTPLSALSASVELLIEQLPTLTAPEIEQLLNSLNIGIVNLQALIDNLIEAASIEAGRFKVNPKPVELNLIIQDAVDTIQPIAEKHHVKITPPRNRQAFLVMADRRRTAQALLNLLSNAIKHSPESSTVTLRTLILGKQVMLEVQDQGKGISTDIQSHLFNRFIAPESEEEQAELGLGLGLSVVKAIIEAQHGNVGFKNSDDEGAIFWFTLPMVEEAAP